METMPSSGVRLDLKIWNSLGNALGCVAVLDDVIVGVSFPV
jgi:hypothetical protein